ncbi:alpha/beta hydrolase [Skermania sp. ID1734]|uniref:alpha/beta hydrolase n=1 Tax=Skermania sp. ID1734 TaxID=2597516 RepID=UPI00117FC940|nr:alpha/beta hydrolase [Skermania sp. ID1734]TSE00723.1 alpha/beta hydrolase [Skermania sp. ID1734]
MPSPFDLAARLQRQALHAMLYFPSRQLLQTPADAGLVYSDIEIDCEPGVRLHAWFVRARNPRGHVLFAHGNAGNIGDRVAHAELLATAGFDVLLFDYRGYGRSTGSPSEAGTYRDGKAALLALRELPGVDSERIIYLGESLGGAVMVQLADDTPPAGLVLTSTFTSVRDVASAHYRAIPTPLVPDAYPSLRRVARLRCPVLIVHGSADEIVPVAQAHRLYEAAAEPKTLRLISDAGHNDLIALAGREWAQIITDWWSTAQQ